MWTVHRNEIRKLRFRALAFVGANQGIVGCVWFVYRKMELRYWLVQKNRINYYEKRSLMPWRLRVPIWINKFLFYSFAALHALLIYGKAADCYTLLRMIGEIKNQGPHYKEDEVTVKVLKKDQ